MLALREPTSRIEIEGPTFWFAVGYCVQCGFWMEREGSGRRPSLPPWHRTHKYHDVRCFAEQVYVREGTSEERARLSYDRARANQRTKMRAWLEKNHARRNGLPQTEED